jgi:N-acetylneuraminic acid mutarotase
MSQARFKHTASVLHGALYIVGGKHAYSCHDSAERFDPMKWAWEGLPSMKEKCDGHSASIMDGKLYVVGGSSGQRTLDSAQRYNPTSGVWEILPWMLNHRESHSSSVVGGLLYVIGGYNSHDTTTDQNSLGEAQSRVCSKVLSSAECFDPARGMLWQELPQMAVARQGHSASVANGMIYVAGGIISCVHYIFERFDPTRGVWERLPDMLDSRVCPSITLMAGMIYVVGGYKEGSADETSERFNLSTGIWENLPQTASRAAAVGCRGVQVLRQRGGLLQHQRCRHSAGFLVEIL